MAEQYDNTNSFALFKNEKGDNERSRAGKLPSDSIQKLSCRIDCYYSQKRKKTELFPRQSRLK